MAEKPICADDELPSKENGRWVCSKDAFLKRKRIEKVKKEPEEPEEEEDLEDEDEDE